MALTDHARTTIENLVNDNRVVLFMKGTPQAPQCGFSANAAGMLDSLATEYAHFNVLEDQDVREGIKDYGQWPTIPQLYIDRELVGGSDIVSEMFNSGELHELLGLEKPDRTPPQITLTDAAVEAIRNGMESQPGGDLHFKIDDYWRGQFSLQPATGNEIKAEAGGIVLHMDILTAQKARGVHIDWVEDLSGSGLVITIPQAPPNVQDLTVKELKTLLDNSELDWLIDVRQDHERGLMIDGARALDQDSMAAVAELPKDTPIAFVCNAGQSSAAVAEHYRKEGYTKLYNVTGGMQAWVEQNG